jgi:hypothetical protein
MKLSALISDYLCVGMSHMTKDGRDAIDEIIYQYQRFKIGDIVCKPSNKPFKSTFKVNTVKGFILNPHTKKLSLTFKEDDSNVEAFCCSVALTSMSTTYLSLHA